MMTMDHLHPKDGASINHALLNYSTTRESYIAILSYFRVSSLLPNDIAVHFELWHYVSQFHMEKFQ